MMMNLAQLKLVTIINRVLKTPGNYQYDRKISLKDITNPVKNCKKLKVTPTNQLHNNNNNYNNNNYYNNSNKWTREQENS